VSFSNSLSLSLSLSLSSQIHGIRKKDSIGLALLAFPLLATQPSAASASLFPHVPEDSTLVKVLLAMKAPVHPEGVLSPLQRAALKAQHAQKDRAERPCTATSRREEETKYIHQIHENIRPMQVCILVKEVR
jgi:hypothetical protein